MFRIGDSGHACTIPDGTRMVIRTVENIDSRQYSVGRTARAAAVGGLIGGSSGARTGARVGVGTSILTSGSSINIPRGTILGTTLGAPRTVPL